MRTLTSFIAGAVLAAAAAGSPSPARAVGLESCIDEALAANPDAQSAEHRVAAARSALREARSAYYPWVHLSGQYARTDNPPQAFMMTLNQRVLNMADPMFNPNEPDDTENLRASLGLQYRLFDSGRRGMDNEMARLGAEAARAGLQAVRNQLVHDVTRGYYGALQAREFVRVQEESVKSLEESLRVAQERFNAGSTVKIDVLNLEVQLAQAREDLIRARNGFELAVAALNTTIGRDLATTANLDPVGTAGRTPSIPEAGSIEGRPELEGARLMADIRKMAWQKARRAYGPTVNAFASSDWDSEVSSDFEQSYMAGVMAELNLFDGFRTRSAVAGAQAQMEAARADLEKARSQLGLDLTQAGIAAREARERLDVTRKSLESAEEALRITHEQYQQGSVDITVLLTAEVGQTAMRTRNVAAEYDYLAALSNLERAQGKLAAKYADGNP